MEASESGKEMLKITERTLRPCAWQHDMECYSTQINNQKNDSIPIYQFKRIGTINNEKSDGLLITRWIHRKTGVLFEGSA